MARVPYNERSVTSRTNIKGGTFRRSRSWGVHFLRGFDCSMVVLMFYAWTMGYLKKITFSSFIKQWRYYKMVRTMEKAIFGLLMVFVLGIGSVLVTAAVTNKNPMDFISSIRVADSGDDNTPEVSEAEESEQLAPLAKITAEQAKVIALSAVNTNDVGEVTDVKIENVDGNVVYAVEFTKAGVETDVKIDAGNGKVLKIENDNDESDVEDSLESELEENKKGSDFEQDGIDHEFEGEEEHED